MLKFIMLLFIGFSMLVSFGLSSKNLIGETHSVNAGPTATPHSDSSEINPQENLDPPEISGSFIQEYQELKIEITMIQRVPEYQSYFPKSDIPRGRKIIAEEGHEIAVVHIHTTRLGDKPGIRVYYLYLLDEEGYSYKGFFTTFSIGTGSESRFDPKEHDYEFPVQIPKDTKISAVQLHQPIRRETQPTTVIQKITFDVSSITN